MTKKKPKDRFQTLTKREKEVLQLVCQHYSYQRIAEKYGISRATVKTHMHNIYVKLGLIYLEKRDERVMQIHNVYCPFFLKDEQPKDIEESEEQTKEPVSKESEIESEEELQEVQAVLVESELEQTPEDKETEEGFQEEQSAPAEQIIDLEFEPEPITPEEEEIIDGDEMALITYTPKTINIGGEEEVNTKKKHGCAKFILTLILGALIVVGAWYTWNNYVKDIPIVQSLVQLIKPDTVVESIPSASSNSGSPDSSSPKTNSSDSESIIEKILPKTDENADAYEIGEWHKEDDLWFRVYRVEISDPLYIYFEIWNKSTDDIFFSWTTKQNISLTDNTGSNYEITESFKYKEENVNLLAGERYDLKRVNYWPDPLYKPNVTELLFSIDYFSRIEHATWRIPVNK